MVVDVDQPWQHRAVAQIHHLDIAGRPTSTDRPTAWI